MSKSRLDIITPKLTITGLQTVHCFAHITTLFSYPIKVIQIHGKATRSTARALAQIALYFKREFHFDFQPYSSHETVDAYNDHFLLITESAQMDAYEGVGGFTINRGGFNTLEWIWLHPFLRGCRILTTLWPILRGTYGDFSCRPPFSDAFQAFLKKTGECWKCGRLHVCSECQSKSNE